MCNLWMSCMIRAVVWITNYEMQEFSCKGAEMCFENLIGIKNNKMLTYRRETALQAAL